jgi:hypothetical protein
VSTPTTDLAAKIGLVAVREFEGASEWAKARLAEWIDKLPGLTDDELLVEAERAIYDSALAARFRGNWDHDHCRASATHFVSRMRKVAAGHDEWCSGPSIYGRAHAAVMRSQGHTPMAEGTCTCDLPGGAK